VSAKDDRAPGKKGRPSQLFVVALPLERLQKEKNAKKKEGEGKLGKSPEKNNNTLMKKKRITR